MEAVLCFWPCWERSLDLSSLDFMNVDSDVGAWLRAPCGALYSPGMDPKDFVFESLGAPGKQFEKEASCALDLPCFLDTAPGRLRAPSAVWLVSEDLFDVLGVMAMNFGKEASCALDLPCVSETAPGKLWAPSAVRMVSEDLFDVLGVTAMNFRKEASCTLDSPCVSTELWSVSAVRLESEDWFDLLGIMGMNFDKEGSCTPELPCVLDRPEHVTPCGALRSNHVVDKVPSTKFGEGLSSALD